MKKYLLILFCIAVTFSCGRANRAADALQGHDHAATSHTHADGTACTGDHSHDENDEHQGHDHAATSHTHADGTACTGDHSHDEHEGHDHAPGETCGDGHDHTENPDEIVFPAEQAMRIGLQVEQVSPRTFSEVIKTSGRVMPAQGQEVTLVAPVAGIVSYAAASLADGRQVSASQDLFYVSSRSIGGGDPAVKAEAAYVKAKADFERAEALLADRIVSQREFEAIAAEYTQAKAEYDALASSRSDRGAGVRSSIGGYVTSLAVAQGDFVEQGQTLATVSQNRRLTLRAEVSQRYYDRMRNVRGANFTVPYNDTTYALADMGGRLLSVGQSAITSTSLIPVTFEFDNNGSVVPGSYVEIYLLGSPVADALTLPVSAITEQQGLYYVYVQLDPECYMKHEVTLGGSDGQRVRILSGVEPGEKVVTKGAINVKLATASAIPHTHEH